MTPTKTPRERFDESFPSLNFSSVEGLKNEDSIARSAIWSFFETLLEEARQEEREKIKEKAEKLKRDITICQCGPGDACDKCPRQKDVSYNFALEHLIQSL